MLLRTDERISIEVMRDEGKRVVREIINPVLEDDNTDQKIDTSTEVNLNELNSIPDVVKSLGYFEKTRRIYLVEKQRR